MRARAGIPVSLAAAAAVGVGYASGIELRAYQIRRIDVPILAPGAAPLTILHLSDAHLRPQQLGKQRFIRELALLRPDLVINTGDSIVDPDAVPAMLSALEPLLQIPGVFVWGSNDYYGPQPKNPARYLMPNRDRRHQGEPLPWRNLRAGMQAAGWRDATHARFRLKAGGRDIEVAGVDDPHLQRDRYHLVAGPVDPHADLTLAVTHSPEPRVLDAFAADGFRLLLAGHTHGGQLRIPGYGALVTNCGLDTGRARGLSRWGAGDNPAWLHVSAGLGTSPYAPVRFACLPEVTLLTLLPVHAAG
jgi:predicted MPP superfamily phosphohydrolase